MHGTRRDLIIAALWAASPAFTEESKVMGTKSMNNEDIGAVSPALEHYTKEALMHGLWKRAELSPRDRSIVTVAALIARMQSNEMPYYFALALDNGVKPGELSEIITHLAFYSGWPNAMAAVSVARDFPAARHWQRSSSSGKVAVASAKRGSRKTKVDASQRQLWGYCAGAGEEHD